MGLGLGLGLDESGLGLGLDESGLDLEEYLHDGHLLVAHGGGGDGRAVGGRVAVVVVGVGLVGVLELLGEVGRGLRRVAREVERRLDRGLDARVGAWLG